MDIKETFYFNLSPIMPSSDTVSTLFMLYYHFLAHKYDRRLCTARTTVCQRAAMRRKVCKPDAENAENGSKYLSYSALPAWLRDNKYILTGYRQEMGDFTKYLQSVFG